MCRRVETKVEHKAEGSPDAMCPGGVMHQRPDKQERHATGDKSVDVVKSREMPVISALLHHWWLAVQFQRLVWTRGRE